MAKWVVLAALLLVIGAVAPARAGDADDCAWPEPATTLLTIAPDRVVSACRRLAENGDAAAQDALGRLYEGGRGVPKSYADAASWYRKAAEQGRATAQGSLGFLYAAGQGVAQDYAEAAKWYLKAAGQGSIDAMYGLGWMYEFAEKRSLEAVKWYEKAAAAKNADASYYLGDMFEAGRGVAQDDKAAAKWYRQAADLGHSKAQYQLGLMYMSGRGVPQDLLLAYLWLNLAAARDAGGALDKRWEVAGHLTPVQVRDAQTLTRNWLQQHPRTTAQPTTPAASSGSAAAAIPASEVDLNDCFNAENLLKTEPARAVAACQRLAVQGVALGEFELGVMYLNGLGVTNDDAKAVDWLRKAAAQGVPPAQFLLAFLLVVGRGVPRDAVEASEWLSKAADGLRQLASRGNSKAQAILADLSPNGPGLAQLQDSLGRMYLMGDDAPEDYQQAMEWFRKAAEQGFPRAQNDLGNMYRQDRAAPHDYVQSYMWFSVAAAQGDTYSASALERVAKRMTPEEIATGRELAAAWKPKTAQ